METCAFLGSGWNEAPGIYLGVSANAQKISTQEIDEILLNYTEAQLATVNMEMRNDRAHQHLYVHLPDRTIVFDGSASEELCQPVWFTLTSSLVGFSKYRGQNFVWCSDKWLCGDPDLFRQHISDERYDRMIWIARDPRDAAVSEMLFRWHRGYWGRKRQYQAHLDLILKKDKDPKSVPFHVICRYAGRGERWPITTEEVVKTERLRYANMAEFVKRLGPEWFLFKYEDMVSGKYAGLNGYLGFEVEKEGQVPEAYGKVIRKRASGDWRHWFTEEDVEVFRPTYLPYMDIIGYDLNVWALSSTPAIQPEYSSVYMQSLPKRVVKDTMLRYKDRVVQRLLGRYDAALVEPGNPVVEANRGALAHESGRLDTAESSLMAAVRLDPDLHQARFNLVRVLARQGRQVAARAEAEELLRRLPDSAPQRPEVERLLHALQ